MEDRDAVLSPVPPMTPAYPSAPQYDRASLGYKKTWLKTVWARVQLPLNLLYCHLLNRRRPLIVVLTTNMNCNWKCGYCYGDYPSFGAEQNLSTAEMIKLIDELAELGCVYAITHGGEALLRKDIGYLVDYMKLKGIYVSFITNGQLFPRRIDELRNVDSLTFSLDGRKENNDKNRGAGTYDMALAAVRLAVKEGFKVKISATITSHSVGDVEYLAALGKELRVPITFSILYRSDVLSSGDPYVLPPDAIRKTVQTIIDLKRKGYPLFTSYQNLEYALRWPYERFKLHLLEGQVPGDFKKLKCHYGRFGFHIEGNGKVMPCTPLASSGFKGKDVREAGTKAALEHAAATNKCVACPFLGQNDYNLLMDLQPREILYLMYEQIQELTRRF